MSVEVARRKPARGAILNRMSAHEHPLRISSHMKLRPGVRIAYATAALCLGGLLTPTAGIAVNCAPPGTSGVDQYYETIPSAYCNQSPSAPGGKTGAHRGSLPAAIRRQLASLGAAGQAVNRLVAATGTAVPATQAAGRTTAASSPSLRVRSRTASHSAAGQPATRAAQAHHPPPPSATGRGLFSGLVHPILGSAPPGGSGILLPLFLGATLLASVAWAVSHRRRLKCSETQG